MLKVYEKRTFIEIDMNIRKFLAIVLNVVFKENAHYQENEKTLIFPPYYSKQLLEPQRFQGPSFR